MEWCRLRYLSCDFHVFPLNAPFSSAILFFLFFIFSRRTVKTAHSRQLNMYPSGAQLEWRAALSREEKAPSCTFYRHASANESQPLVSHQRTVSVLDMLFSLFQHAQQLQRRRPERQSPPKDQKNAERTDVTRPHGKEKKGDCYLVSAERTTPRVTSTPTRRPLTVEPRPSRMFSPSARASEERVCDYVDLPAGYLASLSSTLSEDEMLAPLRSETPREQELLTKLNPLLLHKGAYVSMFSSNAEYTLLTRCHRTGVVSMADVVECWIRLVRCACACLLVPADAIKVLYYSGERVDSQRDSFLSPFPGSACAPRFTMSATRNEFLDFRDFVFSDNSHLMENHQFFMSAASALSGVYAHRRNNTDFELGVVTSGDLVSAQIDRLIGFFTTTLGVPIPFRQTTLPIGAALRGVSLRLWWTPQQRRVTPGTCLAPIKVVLEELYRGQDPHPHFTAAHSSQNTHRGGQIHVFRGYESVSWFLVRPITSRLRGTRSVPLPHTADCSGLYNMETRPAQRSEEGNDTNTDEFHVEVVVLAELQDIAAAEEHAARSPSPGTSPLAWLSTGVVRATLTFSNLSVTTTGEHMLAVEVKPALAYRAFVPTICSYVIPFLVVPDSEAC